MVATALAAADVLATRGLTSKVVSLHTVKPLDDELLRDAFSRFGAVAVVEEHSRLGGLGGAVAEWLTMQEFAPTARLCLFGTPDKFLCASGSQSWFRQQCGLDADSIATKLADSMGSARRQQC